MSGNEERRSYKFKIERYASGAGVNPVPGRAFTEECVLLDTRNVPDWVGWEHEEHFLSRGENHRRNENGTITRDIRYASNIYWFITFSSLQDILNFTENKRNVHMTMSNDIFVGCVGSIIIYSEPVIAGFMMK